MRHSLPAALVAILFSINAAAQDDDDGADGKGGGAVSGSLADGSDPVDTETSDEGRFTPKGKTGKLKEKKKKKQTEEKIEEIPRKQMSVFADLLGVFGTPPDPDRQTVADASEGDVTAYGLVLGGTYDLDPNFTLGLKIPLSRADFKDTVRMLDIPIDGTSNALGNPEVIGQYRMKQSPGVFVPINFGVGIPLGQGDPDPTTTDHPAAAKAMVNRTMDAGTGWHDSELYYVGRVPVSLGVGYVRQRVRWGVEADTKMIAAPKIRGQLEVEGDIPGGGNGEVESYEYNAVALRSVTTASVSGNPWKGLWLGLDAWLVIDIIHEIQRNSDATPPSKFQLVAEPMLGYHFDFMKLSLSYIKPLGGVLQDISGARLRAEFGF